MKYMGSKAKIANDLKAIFDRTIIDNHIKTYIEPFVGGANMITHMVDSAQCIGYDFNKYLIALFNNAEKVKSFPDLITKDIYDKVRTSYNENNSDYEDWYKGAVGFLSSYNGRFFDGGYSGKRIINGKERNYFLEAKKSFLSQLDNYKKIKFIYSSYKNIKVENCLIYCDPPYKNTKTYNVSKKFNYDEFWEWARSASKNNFVFISEQTAPEDFKVIWSKPIKRVINPKFIKSIVENLYIYGDKL